MVGIGRASATTGPSRGDIHLVAFAEPNGKVIGGPHPALIVSSDALNRGAGTVMACPLTSRIRHDADDYLPPYLVSASGRATGLARDGYVKVDQVHTLPVEVLGPRMGRANPETMADVDRALRFVLGI
jgi:mRNA-degrading endonuclease toxin of MazEF toxin-antitoxin module